MKYISLFSGIGGFEVAIHNIFPEAVCVGFSEIDKDAIRVYTHHFPEHHNLGDISKITNEELSKIECDLIVGGFPCKNLSSLASFAGDNSGLEGNQSGLFYELLRVFRIIHEHNPNVNIIVENNASMSNKNRDIITRELSNIKHVHATWLNASEFGVQSRKRILWTTFLIKKPETQIIQTWKDVLEPMDIVKQYALAPKSIECLNRTLQMKRSLTNLRTVQYQDNGLSHFTYTPRTEEIITRWQLSFVSDNIDTEEYPYPIGKSRPVITSAGTNNILIDRRFGDDNEFLVRHLTPIEKERLFFFPDDWTKSAGSITKRGNLLGNSIITEMVCIALDSL